MASAANGAAAVADTGASAADVASEQPAAPATEASSGSSDADTAQTDEPDGATAARNAYQSVVEDGKQASSGISAEDRQTMEEFKSVLQEVRQLMDKAMRELRARNGQPGSSTDSYPLDAQVGASAIPTSITI